MFRYSVTLYVIGGTLTRADCPSSLSGRGGSFSRLLGVREDSESMHHHLKMMLPNGRARSVGRHRQLLDFHGYQVHIAITALLAWHHRTGADLSRWFGQWKPPNHAVSAAA
jgi:hypothetical protein